MTDYSRDRLTRRLDECGIPSYMHDGIIEYIIHGRPVGDFLTAVFNNDLRGACSHADHENSHLLFQYVFFLTNYAPMGCWGRDDATERWIAHRGLQFTEIQQ